MNERQPNIRIPVDLTNPGQLESDCPTDPPDSRALRDRKWIVWYPKKNVGSFGDTLRVPTYDDESGDCTLCDLLHCHSTFINRIEHGKPLKTVDKPKVFERVLYSSVERPVLGAHKYVRDESAKDGKRLINYIRPDHLLDQTAVHLRLTFEHEVPGPLTVGAGRHCGFGLMAEIEA